MADSEFKYWAFLIYVPQDNCERRQDTPETARRCWGNWLHEALNLFSIPPEFIGQINGRGETIPERLEPIFRGEWELSENPSLNAEVRQALEQSRCLVVVCSPRSASSQQVDEAVRYFKQLGRGKHILPIVVAGEPHASTGNKPGVSPADECFVPALRHPVHPDGTLDTTRRAGKQVYVDARHGVEKQEISAKDHRSAEAELEMAKIQLIALLIGVGFPGLWWREQQRHFFDLAEAQHQARQALDAIDEVQRQLQEAERQTRDVQKQALELQNLPRDIHSQIQEAQTQALEARAQSREAQQQLQEFQNKVRETQTQLEAASQRALAAENKVREAQQQAREVQVQLEETRNHLHAARNQAAQNGQSQAEEIGRQAQVAHEISLVAQSQIQEFQNQARAAQSQLEEAREQVREAQGKVLEAQNQARAAQDQVREIQSRAGDTHGQIREFQNKVRETQTQLEEASQRALAAESKVQEAQQHGQEVQAELEETRENLRAARNAQSQAEEIGRQAQAAQDKCLAAESQIQELQSQARSAQNQLEDQLKEAREQVRQIQSRAGEDQGQIKAAHIQVQKIQNQIQNQNRNARRLIRVFALLAVLALTAAGMVAIQARRQREAASVALAQVTAETSGKFDLTSIGSEPVPQVLQKIGGAEQVENRRRSLDKLAAGLPSADISEALAAAAVIVDDQKRSHFQKWLLVRLSWTNPLSAMTDASAITNKIVNEEGSLDSNLYFQLAVLDNWMRIDWPAAFQWVCALPDADAHQRALDEIIHRVQTQPDSEARNKALKDCIDELAKTDLAGALVLAESLPEGAGRDWVMTRLWRQAGPFAILDWINSLNWFPGLLSPHKSPHNALWPFPKADFGRPAFFPEATGILLTPTNSLVQVPTQE